MVFGPKGRLVLLGGLILAPCVARRSLLWEPGSAPPARPGVPLVQKPQGTPVWSLHTRGCGWWAPRCLLGGPLRGVVRSLRRDFRPLEGGVRTSRNAADIARQLSPLRHAGRLHFAVGPPYCQPTHTSVAAVKGCLPDHPRRGRQNASCGALARERHGGKARAVVAACWGCRVFGKAQGCIKAIPVVCRCRQAPWEDVFEGGRVVWSAAWGRPMSHFLL